jgi:hypothetical protein
MTHLHGCPTCILRNVVPDNNKGGKIPTAEFSQRPANFRPRAQRDDVSIPGTVIHEGLSVAETMISGLKGIHKNGFADRGAMKMMNLPFSYLWGLSLSKLSLREI